MKSSSWVIVSLDNIILLVGYRNKNSMNVTVGGVDELQLNIPSKHMKYVL